MQKFERWGSSNPYHAAAVAFPASHRMISAVLLSLSLVFANLLPVQAAPPSSRTHAAPSSASLRYVTSPTDNYIAGMEYAEFWQKSRMPLKVYFHPTVGLAHYDEGYLQLFKDACQSWSDATENRVSFTYVESRENADIDVRWTEDTSAWPIVSKGHELGLSSAQPVPEQGLTSASIYLVTNKENKQIGLKCMKATVLHELGHALGLGHSDRKSDIMTRSIDTVNTNIEGHATLENVHSSVALSKRDITTMKIVYQAKEALDTIRAKNLGTTNTCVVLTNEAARLMNIGDSGQAIVLLTEVLRLDSTVKVAQQNLMMSYYNCGVELYNKQLYGEAMPLLKLAMQLARKVASASQLNVMQVVYQSCSRSNPIGDFDTSRVDSQGAYSATSAPKGH